MKKYIAFNGSGNSGLQTHENAIKWATDQMCKNTALTNIVLCEAIETIERKTPPIEVRPFVLPTEQDIAVAKAA